MPAVLLVALGGAAGGLARAGAGALWPHGAGEWGWSTLAVNAAGAFLLGVLVARGRTSPLLTAGFCAALTTFSGLVLDAVLLADAGRPVAAGAYVLVGLASLLAAAALGLRVARR